MAFTPTTNLSLPLIDTGTESGTWGELVDNGLTSYLDIAIAGGLPVSIVGTTTVTLTNTAGTSSATNIGSTTAQYAILNLSGAMTGACNLVLPSSSRRYVINNACTGGFVLTVKGAATTGVKMSNGESAEVAWNGTDYVKVSSGNFGNSNTAIGDRALSRNTTGTGNVAFGEVACQANTTGYSNAAFGGSALTANTTGLQNTAIGANAIGAGNGGSYNTAIGNSAGYGSYGDNNTYIGYNAGYTMTNGTNNVIIGGYQGGTFPISGSGSGWVVISNGYGSRQLIMDISGNLFPRAAVMAYTPTPAAISTTATLTNANIQAQIIVTSGTSYTVTMPTGTTLDTLATWFGGDAAYGFTVINTASGTVTMAINTGVTSVGSLAVLTGTSAQFRILRTGPGVFIMYRNS